MGVENQPWWNDLLKVRNELSVRELAKRFGVSPGEISMALRNTGTQRQAIGRPEPVPTSEDAGHRKGSKDALLGPLRSILGTISDADAAERVGVSMRTVADYRRRNRIQAFDGQGAPKKRFRRSKIDAYAHLVGKLPDREVAERASVTLNAVRNYRTNRGIPSSRARAKAEREASVGATSVPLAAPSEYVDPVGHVEVHQQALAGHGGFAWKITYANGVDGILVAAEASAAVQLARQSDPDIVRMERIGRMLDVRA